ncbi:hypothetical protein [Microvirga sp. TS319]
MLCFPTVRECDSGKVGRWSEIPTEDKSADDYRPPARSASGDVVVLQG